MSTTRLRVAAVLLVVLSLGATAPAPAAAATAERVLRFQLSGTNGYQVYVQRSEASRNVSVTVWNNRLGAGTEYAVPVPPTASDRIAAKFPGLGRIDVSLETRGRARRNPPPRGCGGRGNLIQPAVARGTIRFRGERGYTRVRATSALAQVVRIPRRRCNEGFGPRPPIRFVANNFDRNALTFFSASKVPGKGGPKAERFEFGLFRLEEARRMFVFRVAWGVGGPSSFAFADRRAAPENVLFKPPAPFSDEATLARTAESTLRWSGSLAVELPGLAPIRLTGPRFGVRFCIEDRCVDEQAAGDDGLDFLRLRGRDALGPLGSAAAAQISGSQSWNFDPARLSWSR